MANPFANKATLGEVQAETFETEKDEKKH